MRSLKPASGVLLAAVALGAWVSVVSADATGRAGATRSISAPWASPTNAGPSAHALDRQSDVAPEGYGRGDWQQPPWVTDRRNWVEQQAAQLRESTRQRQSAMEQWRETAGRWQDPYGQWIRDMSKARRSAMEAHRLQAEDWYQRMKVQPMPGEPWAPDPWGGYPGQ